MFIKTCKYIIRKQLLEIRNKIFVKSYFLSLQFLLQNIQITFFVRIFLIIYMIAVNIKIITNNTMSE